MTLLAEDQSDGGGGREKDRLRWNDNSESDFTDRFRDRCCRNKNLRSCGELRNVVFAWVAVDIGCCNHSLDTYLVVGIECLDTLFNEKGTRLC
ncbi:hypothetical protein CEXT_803691 [Caerostris extrusa]|uniref:Uncharacterized protein n=1 Tax=Caerostris extrusa TaxID=172846 RepID=A0AAV4YCT0_CAEEX|nr:hypothetical protein CEXT_803691 [Caerostris extrusa]